ncbi:MAG: phosphatidylserine decarboxylase family protein [Bacteroidota bacterium]|jgi:phosphatidylserine decarboxylase|nr:phosphatidylserine decarboxylase family protein [Chitinophagaceae bacterium]
MRIHKEGIPTIAITTVLVALLSYLSNQWMPSDWVLLTYIINTVLVVFLLFIISFFRIPNRTFHYSEHEIVSPADGKVVVIEEVFDEEYFHEKRLQISVFMSPANVHVNRYPMDGEVIYSKYHPGKYLVAWDPKSSTDNERHSIVVKNNKTVILVKQIAGALARRIVNYAEVGKNVQQNQELGFIKFGSRVDLLLPLDAKPAVKIGDHVKNGISVLAAYGA